MFFFVLPSFTEFFFSIRYGSIRLPTNWQSAKSFSAYYRVFLLFLAFGFDPTGCATASLLFLRIVTEFFLPGLGMMILCPTRPKGVYCSVT